MRKILRNDSRMLSGGYRLFWSYPHLKVLLGIQSVKFAIFVSAAMHHDRATANRAVFYVVRVTTGGVNQGLEAFTAVRAAYFLSFQHSFDYNLIARLNRLKTNPLHRC